MLYDAIDWAWYRFRPREGWLPLFLLLLIMVVAGAAVTAVEWVPEDSVVYVTALLGLLMATLLANRNTGWKAAWALLSAYGLMLTVFYLGLLPTPISLLFNGWAAYSEHFRQNWGLLIDRLGGWFVAVSGEGFSEETIVFALGLGLISWFAAAYAGWSTFRQHHPLTGLTALGILLAINVYFGNAGLWSASLFVGFGALLVATIHNFELEKLWKDREVDYSEEIRLDLLVYSGAIALGILTLAFAVPNINYGELYRVVFDRPAIHELEETFGQAFAGVQQPRREGPGAGGTGQPASFRRDLPRSFLIGDPPELYDIVVMTATVQGPDTSPNHWRGTSYDVYTGRGWALSDERQEPLPAGEQIALSQSTSLPQINQRVSWILGQASTRYTLGMPLAFDRDSIAHWRGLGDLIRVTGEDRVYEAVSRSSLAAPDELRLASLAGVPDAIMARYTRLPDSVPERVLELAQEIGGDAEVTPTPYDQARAVEQFLRQYTYNLEVALPPASADPVDYFLFQLQEGYCDYYASAMVVLARALGLPARYASGYLAQQPDQNGVQTIYQINAHAWAEIYFAGFGWIEFEPTAAFSASEEWGDEQSPDIVDRPQIIRPEFVPPPIPEQDIGAPFPFWILVLIPILIAAGIGWFWFRGRREEPQDSVLRAYGKLQRGAGRLGLPAAPSQTPGEYEQELLAFLGRPARRAWLARMRSDLLPDVARLSSIFVSRQYAPEKPAAEPAVESWQRIRLKLRILGLLRRFDQNDEA